MNRSSKILSWVTIGLTILIFGGAIVLVTLQLRFRIRDQITSRDGEILAAVALMQQMEEAESELSEPIDRPAAQFELILKTSRLSGAIAFRLFDPRGQFMHAFPPTVADARLTPQTLQSLRNLRPVSHYQRHADLAEIFLVTALAEPGGNAGGARSSAKSNEKAATSTAPLLEVLLPIHRKDESQLLGIAQLLIDGESIARQFAALDRHLFRQALIIFSMGSALIGLGLHEAFRRLKRSNRLLSSRTQELLRANQELLLVAKTSAVGAVTGHLIHGLKNPLFGLRNLVNECAQDPSKFGEQWKTAAVRTDQMHAIVNDVVRVLRDEHEMVQSHIAFDDLAVILSTKFRDAAREMGVEFVATACAEGLLPHRTANLVILILQNLVQNAIQATPSGKKVELIISQLEEELVCEVHDEGPGISRALRKALFAPCRSTKPDSSGLGLAISKQLANQLGAMLELERSDSTGSVFCLRLPENLIVRSGVDDDLTVLACHQ